MAPKRNKATNQSVYTARQTRSQRLLTQQQRPDNLEDVDEEADHQEQDGNEAADQDVNREEDHYRHDVNEEDSDAEVVIENEIYRTTRRRGAVISVINLDEESDSDVAVPVLCANDPARCPVAVGLHRGGGSSLAQDESATQLASNSARPAHTHTIRTNPASSSTSQSTQSISGTSSSTSQATESTSGTSSSTFQSTGATFAISSSTSLSTEATTMVRANTLDMTVDLISPLRSTTTQVVGGARRDAATPPRMQNILDETVDLTDSPMTAPGTVFSTNMPASVSTNASVSTAASASSPLTDSSSPAVTSSASPGSTALIRCPVCLDDLQKIRSAQKTVMSTVCGHLFCSSCLPICLRESRRCPTCRRFLNARDIHPIFI